MATQKLQTYIKGGTLVKLFDLLFESDEDLLDTFLLTYRTYLTPEELLQKLMERYWVTPKIIKKEYTETEIEEFEKRKKFIRVKLGQVVQRWLTWRWHDWVNDPELLQKLRDLIEKSFNSESDGFTTMAKKLFKTISDQQEKEKIEKEKKRSFSQEAPDPIIPSKKDFSEFDPKEVARQLCLYEQALFQAIHPRELLGQQWVKHKHNAPNILKMTKFFNEISDWISTQIVSCKAEKERVKLMKKFIQVMIYCKSYNNFNSVLEIHAALEKAPVYRLNKTRKKVEKDKKLWAGYSEIKELISGDGNMKVYREALRKLNPPCLPYLGRYLTDLTFVEDGNKDYLSVEGRDDILHFEKMRKVAAVIQQIILYQQTPYNFIKVDIIHDFLGSGLECLTEDQMYKLSLEVEPRQ